MRSRKARSVVPNGFGLVWREKPAQSETPCHPEEDEVGQNREAYLATRSGAEKVGGDSSALVGRS